VFPIGDEHNGRRLTPVVNFTLIALNVLVFLYEVSLSEPRLVEFIFDWGAIPDYVSAGDRWFTLWTSAFVHGGWVHLAGNMLFLWVFGDNVEDTMGHLEYLLFYLLCAAGGSALQVFVQPDSMTPIVGASGAIAGILGAYVLLFPRGKIRTLFFFGLIPFILLIPAWIQLGLWIFIQFVNGFAALEVATRETGGGTAWFAHIGGFATGALLVYLFADKDALAHQRAMREGHRAFQRMAWRE
jgi:membrane associated rhomboid family serine protease